MGALYHNIPDEVEVNEQSHMIGCDWCPETLCEKECSCNVFTNKMDSEIRPIFPIPITHTMNAMCLTLICALNSVCV